MSIGPVNGRKQVNQVLLIILHRIVTKLPQSNLINETPKVLHMGWISNPSFSRENVPTLSKGGDLLWLAVNAKNTPIFLRISPVIFRLKPVGLTHLFEVPLLLSSAPHYRAVLAWGS